MASRQSKTFDITAALERLIKHIALNCQEFSHIDIERIIVSTFRTRSPGMHGVYASLQPLRFKNGEREVKRKGRTYVMPEIRQGDKEILYIIYFAVPRFLNLSFEEKLTTIFHELYHISPQFNGDLRRFAGKNYAHGHSRKRYNENLQKFINHYLSLDGTETMTEFLRHDFKSLEKRKGALIGTRIKPPKPMLA